MTEVKRVKSFFGSVFEPFLYNDLSLIILKSKGNFELFIERLHSFAICKAKTSASSLGAWGSLLTKFRAKLA